jgi:hypothetical protein
MYYDTLFADMKVHDVLKKSQQLGFFIAASTVLDIVYFLKALKYYWEKNRPIVYNR